MLNLNRCLIAIILSFPTLQLLAAETDWNQELQINQIVRGQLMAKESEIKRHRSFIHKEKVHLKELRDELKVAVTTNDEHRLQNVFRVLIPKLERMQASLAMQDDRLENYRLSLFRPLQNAERIKKSHLKEPTFDEELAGIGGLIYEQMSQEDKVSVGSRIAKILDARKKLERLNETSDKLLSSPYGTVQGLVNKHVRAILDRFHLNIEIKQCVRLESIARSILDHYVDKAYTEEQTATSDYSSFLESFDNIIDSLHIEETPVDNPYLRFKESAEQ